MADLNSMATDRPSAASYRLLLERVQRDLWNVATFHESTTGPDLVVVALIEVCAVLSAQLVEADPGVRAQLLNRLDQLRLFVSTAGERQH